MNATFAFDIGEFSTNAGGVCVKITPGMSETDIDLLAQIVRAAQEGGLDTRWEVVKSFLRHDDPAKSFLSVAASTLFCHEVRHFHDLLLTNVGQCLMLEKINLAGFAPYSLSMLCLRDTFILPIEKWIAVTPDVLKMLRRDARPRSLPDGWALSVLATLREVFAATEDFFAPMRTTDNLPATDLPRTIELYEGMSTSCQLAELNLLDDGSRHSIQTFVEYLSASGNRLYIDYFDYIETAEKRLGLGSSSDHWTAFNALSLFSLCALLPKQRMKYEHVAEMPSIVFHEGLLDIYRIGRIPTPDETISFLDSLARRLKLLTLDEALAALRRMVPHRLEAVRPVLDEADPTKAAVLEGYAGWLRAHAHMLDAVRADPLSYCNPFSYVRNLGAGHWVSCPIYVPVTSDNATGFRRFVHSLNLQDKRHQNRLLEEGDEARFAHLGMIDGVEVLPPRETAAMFTMMRLGTLIWRGLEDQVEGRIAKRELKQRIGGKRKVYYI